MIIRSAKFVKSSQDVSSCPSPNLPEYAFIGRSNVGKSSLINMITGLKSLAKVSGTPGKTQLINHFVINENWYLVDLPGYGFAKVPKSKRGTFIQMINNYILKRENLYCLFVLVDVRHEPQEIDTEFINWLGEHQVPFAIIFTKADKLSTSVLKSSIENYKKFLLQSWDELPLTFTSSAVTKSGREDILEYIESINRNSAIDHLS